MKNYLLIALVLLLSSCGYDFPATKLPQAGEVDFTNYVAIGNSITAGYMDGALYTRGQQNSFPNILSSSFKTVVGEGFTFNQPDINAVNGYYGIANGALLGRLKLNAQGSPQPTKGDPIAPYADDRSKLNNLGIPGLRSYHISLANYGSLNPYYGRFANATTLLEDINAKKPTFFTFFVGNNDVLSYGLSGGTNPGGSPGTFVPAKTHPGLNPATYGPNDMTQLEVFQASISGVLNSILASNPNSKGVVANIPDFTKIPYFSYPNSKLTSNGKPLQPFTLSAEQAAQLNGAYLASGYNSPGFTAGSNNYFAIVLPDGKVRQMNPKFDFITLPFLQIAPTELPKGLGTVNATKNPPAQPIGSNYVLDSSEVSAIQKRINEYNTFIEGFVKTKENLVMVDINKSFSEITKNVISVKGIAFLNTLEPPYGGFSLDGVHPNGRGSAYIANEFIKAINGKFNSTLVPVNINDYYSNDLPQ